MTKKIIALLLSVLLILSLTACNTAGEATRGTVTPVGAENVSGTQAATQPQEGAAFSVGSSTGNHYSNAFLGLQCQLDGDWVFATDEEIQQINAATVEALGEDYAKAVEKAASFTDMYAMNTQTGATVNITMEKSTLATALISAADYAELSKNALPDALAATGWQIKDITSGEMEFAGKTCPCLTLQMEVEGVTLWEKMAILKTSGYFVSVTAASTVQEDLASALAAFSAI